MQLPSAGLTPGHQPAGSPAANNGKRWRVPPLLVFMLRRALAAIPVMIGVTFICFGIMQAAPGDPVRIIMGQHYDEEVAAQIKAKWGLDKPFLVQYGLFVSRVVQGDLGRSYVKNTEIGPFLRQKFINTLLLSLVAMAIAIVAGMLAGIVSAARPRSWSDYLLMFGAIGGISIPVFWLGLMLQLLFASKLGWFPVSGISLYSGDMQRVWQEAGGNYLAFWWHVTGRYYVLPSITLATVPMAIIARLTRSSMLEVMNLDYIKTARAKGLGNPRVVLVHALKNAAIPIVTVIGNNFALLLTGAVLTETVFSWDGLGRAMVEAINQYDYPVVMGGVLIMASVFVLVNLLVDLAYGIIDPRVRYN